MCLLCRYAFMKPSKKCENNCTVHVCIRVSMGSVDSDFFLNFKRDEELRVSVRLLLLLLGCQ